jgi:hypothetical protein
MPLSFENVTRILEQPDGRDTSRTTSDVLASGVPNTPEPAPIATAQTPLYDFDNDLRSGFNEFPGATEIITKVLDEQGDLEPSDMAIYTGYLEMCISRAKQIVRNIELPELESYKDYSDFVENWDIYDETVEAATTKPLNTYVSFIRDFYYKSNHIEHTQEFRRLAGICSKVIKAYIAVINTYLHNKSLTDPAVRNAIEDYRASAVTFQAHLDQASRREQLTPTLTHNTYTSDFTSTDIQTSPKLSREVAQATIPPLEVEGVATPELQQAANRLNQQLDVQRQKYLDLGMAPALPENARFVIEDDHLLLTEVKASISRKSGVDAWVYLLYADSSSKPCAVLKLPQVNKLPGQPFNFDAKPELAAKIAREYQVISSLTSGNNAGAPQVYPCSLPDGIDSKKTFTLHIKQFSPGSSVEHSDLILPANSDAFFIEEFLPGQPSDLRSALKAALEEKRAAELQIGAAYWLRSVLAVLKSYSELLFMPEHYWTGDIKSDTTRLHLALTDSSQLRELEGHTAKLADLSVLHKEEKNIERRLFSMVYTVLTVHFAGLVGKKNDVDIVNQNYDAANRFLDQLIGVDPTPEISRDLKILKSLTELVLAAKGNPTNEQVQTLKKLGLEHGLWKEQDFS